MAETVIFGDKWHELNRLPDLEHELFYKFLLVSPSYRLHHRISQREIRFPKKELPSDRDEVIRTYRICGDVYAKGFEEWWTDIGCHVFTPRQNTNVILSLDFSKPRDEVEKEVARLIDMGYRLRHDEASLNLLPSKIRVDTTKRLSKLTRLSLDARIQLSELISRQGRELMLLAENAARGRFPSKGTIETPFTFDYPYIEYRFNPGGYPYSKSFTHSIRMRHPIFRHLMHLEQRKKDEQDRKKRKSYPDLDRLMREFDQLLRRKG